MPRVKTTEAWAVVHRKSGQLTMQIADDGLTLTFTVLPDKRDIGGFSVNEEPGRVVIVDAARWAAISDALVDLPDEVTVPFNKFVTERMKGEKDARS